MSVRQLVLTPNFRDIAFKSLHDDAGHQGQKLTLSLLRARFHWPGMEKEIENRIKSCANVTGEEKAHGPTGTRIQDFSHYVRAL